MNKRVFESNTLAYEKNQNIVQNFCIISLRKIFINKDSYREIDKNKNFVQRFNFLSYDLNNFFIIPYDEHYK